MGDLEAAAKALFETWGGPWEKAPEFRRREAREEAQKVIDAFNSAEHRLDDSRATIPSTGRGEKQNE